MPAYSPLILRLIGPLFALIFVLLIIRMVLTAILRRRKRNEPAADLRRCRCGYPLVGLSIPRCPECGRAIGFDCSFEELGISEEEVRRNIEARRAERESGARQARGDNV